jgi:hypothetical protein
MSKKDFNDTSFPPNMAERLKAAREADPNWEKAIKRVVEAEATLSPSDDPAEGKIIATKPAPKPNR